MKYKYSAFKVKEKITCEATESFQREGQRGFLIVTM